MKAREFISILAAMGAHADIRDFEIQSYDPNDSEWREVTDITVSPQKQTILIHTDER